MSEETRPHVLLFPYLPLGKRVEVGFWELIPRADFADEDALATRVAEQVRGVFDLYTLRGSLGGVGALVRAREGKVGDVFAPEAMRPLRRAVVAALLDGNPTIDPTTKHSSQGHAVATSDNALLYGHRLDPEGYVAVQYGVMVETAVGGLKIGTDYGEIHPPAELHLPLLGPFLDGEYADALHALLTAQDERARRLGRAIDWLDLAWRNTVSIDEETRLLMLHSGFEVLLGEEGVEGLRAALSALLDEAGATRRPRTWTSRGGKPTSAELTDLEWWFTQFSFLRNKIVHGEEIPDGDFILEGKRHLWHAEMALRRALKQTVVNAGYPDVALDSFERALKRSGVIEELVAEGEALAGCEGEGASEEPAGNARA